ncbi:hypothetical protein SAMN05720766_1157 [Fibrobacter sp. UWH9]|uniref:hypothetical protein n=1 Tax=unclassified Fibrobacter TaxID=2634177 RepID=UPI00092116D2|nr:MULTISPECIES: hypothetical protein [unclassified Fibrobacter]MCQ2122978.1 hypothetical protein [Fibrobacter sp.]OWV14885.1 hypothetical protein B7992_07165 [Fibrobacter sp. UWH1]SHH55563.1 hypothetical protein SAMN05720766_1157 [Fibrobacter sp. UWH9]
METKDVKTPSTMEILNKGMKCLTEHLGVVDAEYFISAVKRENFDYTEWRKTAFNEYKSLKDLLDDAERTLKKEDVG